MVLNQWQVLVIVSDWEPYLGSLFVVLYYVVFTFIALIKHVEH